MKFHYGSVYGNAFGSKGHFGGLRFGSSVFDDDAAGEDDWSNESGADANAEQDEDTNPVMWQPPVGAPTPPVGYKYCFNPEVRGNSLSESGATDKPGWIAEHWAGKDGLLYYRYVKLSAAGAVLDFVWACPKWKATNAPKSDVILIQQALDSKGQIGWDGKRLKIDGVIGRNTCFAMYSYIYRTTGIADPTITEANYASLGLGGRSFGQKYARLCDQWYTGEIGKSLDELNEADEVREGKKEPDPPPVVPKTPTTPKTPKTPVTPHKDEPIVTPPPVEPDKAGFPLWLGILLGGGLLVGAIVMPGRKAGKGKKKGRR